MSSDRFKRLIGRLPVSWQEMLGHGIQFLADELNSEKVDLAVADNGVAIVIECDEESRKEAQKFWTKYVEPQISEGD
jgi:hypothetical protein